MQGPAGTVVNQQPLASADANQVQGQAALSLVPGAYTLTVSAQGTTTGDYTFQLLDLANATPITVGQQVAGQLNPGDSTNLYQFQGTTGESLFFESQPQTPQNRRRGASSGPRRFVVFGPTQFGQDPGVETLTLTGTYTLMVEGNINQTSLANYDFTVFQTSTTQTALTLGQPVTGALTTPGMTNDYNFTLTQPTKVLFDSLTDSAAMQWTLTGSQHVDRPLPLSTRPTGPASPATTASAWPWAATRSVSARRGSRDRNLRVPIAGASGRATGGDAGHLHRARFHCKTNDTNTALTPLIPGGAFDANNASWHAFRHQPGRQRRQLL